MARTKDNGTIFSPQYLYWSQVNARNERLRREALKRGESAPYGYWKPDKRAKRVILPDEYINDIPDPRFYKEYKLEMSYKQANQVIQEFGDDTVILLLVKTNLYFNQWHGWGLTPKNAYKLPNNHFIRDVNERLCLFRKKKFYLII